MEDTKTSYETLKDTIKAYITNGVSDSGGLDNCPQARANCVVTALFATMVELDLKNHLDLAAINLNRSNF